MVHCPRDANTPHTFTRKDMHIIMDIRNFQVIKYPVKVSRGHLPCWRTVYRRAGGCWLLGIAGSVSGHCSRGEIIARATGPHHKLMDDKHILLTMHNAYLIWHA